MVHTCKKCGNCCRYLEFWIDKDDETTEEFYRARGLTLYDYDDHYILIVPNVCIHLTDDNLCAIHDNKPQACKDWPVYVEGFPEPCIYGVSRGED